MTDILPRMTERIDVEDIAKVLAVLVAEQGSYTYVDKIGYAPSTDLAVSYLKEALRDYHSLLRKEKLENEDVRKLMEEIKDNIQKIEDNIQKIAEIEDRRKLRRITSLISSKALITSARYIKERREG